MGVSRNGVPHSWMVSNISGNPQFMSCRWPRHLRESQMLRDPRDEVMSWMSLYNSSKIFVNFHVASRKLIIDIH